MWLRTLGGLSGVPGCGDALRSSTAPGIGSGELSGVAVVRATPASAPGVSESESSERRGTARPGCPVSSAPVCGSTPGGRISSASGHTESTGSAGSGASTGAAIPASPSGEEMRALDSALIVLSCCCSAPQFPPAVGGDCITPLEPILPFESMRRRGRWPSTGELWSRGLKE